jgi:hypothetical protein
MVIVDESVRDQAEVVFELWEGQLRDVVCYRLDLLTERRSCAHEVRWQILPVVLPAISGFVQEGV